MLIEKIMRQKLFLVCCSLFLLAAMPVWGQTNIIRRQPPTTRNNGVSITAGEYVDLGLPSGTLWATKNIGASKPEEHGDYFAWGETKGYNDGKTDFDWPTYKHCNGSSYRLLKYNSNSRYGKVDNRSELEFVDDAAYQNRGSSWCMPTYEQFKELKDNCSCRWVTYRGTKGLLVKGRNGNSLFFPASGFRMCRGISYFGSDGRYWTRTLKNDSPDHAFYFMFGTESRVLSDMPREMGISIRPVRLKK